MSAPRIARIGRRPAAPVRIAHLGLGAFFRAHQARYTDLARDRDEWGIAAFAGRGERLARQLDEQEGIYTLVTRGPRDDDLAVVGALSRAYPAAAHEDWLDRLAAPDLAAVTITVTESGYRANQSGALDRDDPLVARDIHELRADRRALVRSAPGRLVAGLAARRSADEGSIAVVPCDNLPGNGQLVRRVVDDLARSVDSALADWIAESICFASTMVDRITPPTTPADVDLVAASGGWRDACPVVTEPFTEWVLAGQFPAGRPRWEDGGARFTDDVVPDERRKLWLLNGAHSVLAYTGIARGRVTIADAADDPVCAALMQQWWVEAMAELSQPVAELDAYRARLAERFGNRRIGYPLAQVATDATMKLPIRIVAVLRSRHRAGRPAPAAVTTIAAWIAGVRRDPIGLADPRRADLARLAAAPVNDSVRGLFAVVAPDLAEDVDLLASVRAALEEWQANGRVS